MTQIGWLVKQHYRNTLYDTLKRQILIFPENQDPKRSLANVMLLLLSLEAALNYKI